VRALVVGGGGREHALVWQLAKSSLIEEIVCAPGNPGIAALAECVDIKADDIGALVDLATRTRPGLVVIGPEAPLAAGLADALKEQVDGTAVFGPTAEGAKLESSKSFAKNLMVSKGIPTADARWFDSPDGALEHVKKLGGPVVVKADGLAAGKGVYVCNRTDEAIEAIAETMVGRRFGASGTRVLIEEKLEGEELSILAFCDGQSVLPMKAAQDFKRAFDGDLGPNTGGMGAYSPAPVCTEEVFGQAVDQILEPIVAALADHNAGDYQGMLYAGLILTETGPKVIEFNCRFGDPETQALLPLLTSDLAEVMLATVEKQLPAVRLEWSEASCVCLVAASPGYPGPGETPVGLPIEGVETAEAVDGVVVFHSGTALTDGNLVTAGGRVLSISATGTTLGEARENAYEAMSKIRFAGIQYRTDIASRALTYSSGGAR